MSVTSIEPCGEEVFFIRREDFSHRLRITDKEGWWLRISDHRREMKLWKDWDDHLLSCVECQNHCKKYELKGFDMSGQMVCTDKLCPIGRPLHYYWSMEAKK